MKTYACFSCNFGKPCILTGIDETDCEPDTCIVGGTSSWVEVESVDNLTRVMPEEPYDSKEAWADKQLEAEKDERLMNK